MTTDKSVASNIGWPFWFGWASLNAFGFALAGLLFHNFPFAFGFPPSIAGLGQFEIAPAVFGAVLGAVPLIPVGWLNGVLLRRHFALSRWWGGALPVGVGLLHFLSDGFPNAYDLSLAVLASGVVVGVFQWNLLRRVRGLSAWWILAMALGWYLGWVLGFGLLEAGRLGRLDYEWKHALLGLTTGLGHSALTAWALRPPRS